MGSELKTIENCENVIRNRKNKDKQNENTEKSSKNKLKQIERVSSEKPSHQVEAEDEIAQIKASIKMASKSEEKPQQTSQEKSSPINFTIKIEFDPMSIALFLLAIVTRFFRLSEPKNVV